MGALYKYKKDGYIFEDHLGSIVPWPIARVDASGNEIPLSIEEIDFWRKEYLKEHPNIKARIDGITNMKNDSKNQKLSFFKKILNYIKGGFLKK